VDLTYQRIRRGDVLVLCSDGLSGQVTRDQIAQVVTENQDLVQACRKLIDLANAAGGPDNITVIIARFMGEGLNEFGEGDDVGHRVFALPDTGTPPTAIERITEGPTQPMRPSRQDDRTTVPVVAESDDPAASDEAAITVDPQDEAAIDAALATTDPIIEPVNPEMVAKRRSRGIAVALVLLAALIAFAAWYAVQTARKVQATTPPADPATPTQSAPQPTSP
jgi:protein phosphatase